MIPKVSMRHLTGSPVPKIEILTGKMIVGEVIVGRKREARVQIILKVLIELGIRLQALTITGGLE